VDGSDGKYVSALNPQCNSTNVDGSFSSKNRGGNSVKPKSDKSSTPLRIFAILSNTISMVIYH
jgi:hypothetical protein